MQKRNGLQPSRLQEQFNILKVSYEAIEVQKQDMATQLRKFQIKGDHSQDEFCMGYFEAMNEVKDMINFFAESTGIKGMK